MQHEFLTSAMRLEVLWTNAVSGRLLLEKRRRYLLDKDIIYYNNWIQLFYLFICLLNSPKSNYKARTSKI